jgi:hypothetical protein
MRLRLLIVLPLMALALAGSARPARAQSLADVARKEAERRKELKVPAKVITNKDLGGPSTSSGSADAAKPEPSQKDADDKTKSADGTDKAKDKDKDKDDATPKDEKYWRERTKALQAALDHDQAFADALQVQINSLTTDFVNRDDPAQRAVIGQNKQKAIDELTRLTKAIGDDKKAIADLQEEARKAGAPPGWLR